MTNLRISSDFVQMVKRGDFIVLDTETTGLDAYAEICQIAIVDSAGQTLLNSFVKPFRPIPPDATRIHHITNEMVQDAPKLDDLMREINQIFFCQNLVIYNADYDTRLLRQSTDLKIKLPSVWCAMLEFSKRYGDWNEYHGNYRWQKLDTAVRFYRLGEFEAHSALGDALATLAVCRAMAQEYQS